MLKKLSMLCNSDFERLSLKSIGVYSIYFVGTNKFYIGSTSGKDGFYGRWRLHLYALRKGIHTNSIMLNTYNKYGEALLKLKIIELCEGSPEHILAREQYYLDTYKPTINVNLIASGCEFPEGWVSPLAKPVLLYDLEGNFIKEYSSISEAKRTIDCDITQAIVNLDKHLTLAGGFQWRLKENNDFPLKISKYKNSQEKTILCYDCNGNFYKEYPSVLKAATDLNLCVGNISKNLNGLARSCCSYFFKEKTTEDYPLHINAILRYHKNLLTIEIEDIETGEIFHFNSLRLIPKDIINRHSLYPYTKKGLKEFTFTKRDSKKQYKIKIQNYNLHSSNDTM